MSSIFDSMKKLFYLFALSGLLTSCGGFNCVEGTGEVITREIDLDVIRAIENNTSVDIFLRYGMNQKVEVTGYRNHIELLSTAVNADRWIIDFKENVCNADMSILITLPEIDAIEVDGSGDITALTPFQGKEFEVMIDGSGNLEIDISAEEIQVEIDGSGDVKLSGYAESISISVDGSGDVMAYEMIAKQAQIDSDGSGDVQLTVEEEIEVTLKGSGNVSYKGEPEKMEFSKKGSGEIEKR